MEKVLQFYYAKKRWIERALQYWIWTYLSLNLLKNLIWMGLESGFYFSYEHLLLVSCYALLAGVLLLWVRPGSSPWRLLAYPVTLLFQFAIDGVLLFSQIPGYLSAFSAIALFTVIGVYVSNRFLHQFSHEEQLLIDTSKIIDLERMNAVQLNNELAGMYEELEANDEELRAQYQELQDHRDHLVLVQKRNSLIFEASSEVIWELDLKTGLRHFGEENYVDEVALDLIQSPNFSEWAYDLHPDDQQLFTDAMTQVMEGILPYHDFEIRVDNLNGGWKWLRSKVVSLKDEDGNTIMMAGSYSDIDDRKQKEKRIHHLAYHDHLTDLANRVSLIDVLNESIKRRGNTWDCSGVFFYIDMDGFGAINNTFGHDIGDQLIQQIGYRLMAARSQDFIARMGGADFGLFTEEKVFCTEPNPLAEQLLALLREPYMVDRKVIHLTASIGVTVFSESIINAESVIRHGDIALRQAKSRGKDRFEIYHKRMSEEVSLRLLMANELRNAIDKGELYMCFQPQIDLEHRELYGFESLLRWNSPTYGLVPPDQFIPLAEETGLIIPIGNWVFEQSCKFLKALNEINEQPNKPIVSVNVAAQQLEQISFLVTIKETLERLQVPPEQMCIEVTETSVIKSLDTAIRHLEALKAFKLKVALDDFGTGFSSLNHLNELPIDVLKIDKSFTRRITDSSKEFSLIKSIIRLSKDLGLSLVVEGVEVREQIELLCEMGCPIIQGYYFGKPMPHSIALAYFAEETFTSELHNPNNHHE